MGNLRGIYILWYRDILRLWRDKTRIVGSLMFPLLFLAMGAGLSGSLGASAPSGDFAKFMYPGILGISVLMTALMSGVGIVWDRQFGFLKEVLVAPISRASVALGKTMGGATIALLQGSLIFFFAPLLGVQLNVLLVVELLLIMFIMAASLASLGIFIASRMRSMEAFQMVMQLLLMPMIFLSGTFFPVGDGLPAWLGVLVRINPVTYAVDPLRQLLLGSQTPALSTSPLPAGLAPNLSGLSLFGHVMSIADDLIIVVGFGVLMTILAMWSFSRQE